MYTADHIVVSTTLAALGSKKFGKPFLPLAVTLILSNLVDLDHLFYFRLDDGTANSLSLHPLHIYSTSLIFLISLLGFFDKKRVLYYFLFIASLSSHMAADSLAFSMSYNLNKILIYDFFQFVLVFFAIRYALEKSVAFKVFSFLVLQWFILNGIMLYVTGISPPQENIIVWIIPQVMTILVAFLFYRIFKKSFLE